MPQPLPPTRQPVRRLGVRAGLAALFVTAAGVIALAQQPPSAGPTSADGQAAAPPPAIRAPTASEATRTEALIDAANAATQAKDWVTAEARWRDLMAIEIRTFGPRHPQSLETASLIGDAMEMRGSYEAAEALRRQVLEDRRSVHGDNHAETATAYSELALNLNRQKRYEDASSAYDRALMIRAAVFGPASVEAAVSARNAAANLRAARRPAEAEAILRRTLDARAATTPADLQTARLYAALAAVLDGQQRTVEAGKLHERALDIALEDATTPLSVLGDFSNGLAANLVAQGRYVEAELLFRRVLKIDEARSPHPSLALATTLSNLSATLAHLGRFAEAEALARKSLETRLAVVGPNAAEAAAGYTGVAHALYRQGRYAEAEPLLRRAWTIYEVSFGPEDVRTLTAIMDIAANLSSQDRHEEAERLQRRVLEARRRLLGEDHLSTADAHMALAITLLEQDRPGEAAPILLRAHKIRTANLGVGHPRSLESLATLARVLSDTGEDGQAESALRFIAEQQRKTLGERHPDVVSTRIALASAISDQGRHSEAELIYREALDIGRSTYDSGHHMIAEREANLALNLSRQQRHAEAERAAAGALTTIRTARDQQWRLAPDDDDAPFASLRGIFSIYLRAAVDAAPQAGDDRRRIESTAFEAAQDLEVSPASVSLARAAARIAAGQAGLADAVRRRQQLGLQRRDLNARQVAALGRGDQMDLTAVQQELERLAQQTAQLDMEIRQAFPLYAELTAPRALSVNELQARLRPEEAVLLMVAADDDIHVFAVTQSQVKWLRRKDRADSTETAVAALRGDADVSSGVARGAVGAYGRKVGGAAPFDRASAYGLYRDLVQPMEDTLQGVKTLYVVSSGALSGLPLGLLLTEAPQGGSDADGDSRILANSSWLADKYALVTLPSVSSLRALGALKVAPGRLALAGFGSPSLALADPAAPRGLRAFRGAVGAGGMSLADPATLRTMASLPETETELRTMARALGAPASAVHLGPAATETAVKTSADLSQARVVIFATHGLLPRELKGLEEPGLVFTPPATATAEDDGVLTASEAARLNLSADWVILSACNTAAADGTPGAESLSGLAKAFLYAGAQALLASHWRVADDSTSVLTVQTLAIQKANPGFSKAQALQAAMKAVRTGKLPDGSPLPGWKPQWAHPAAWAPFTLVSAGG